MVFGCIPVRTAVFVCGVLCAIGSLLLLPASIRHTIELDRRTVVGGYTMQSRVIIDILEQSAIIWGTLGAVGSLYLKANMLRAFLGYQVVRLLAWLLMFFLDAPVLMNCEEFRDDVKHATELYGQNTMVYSIATSGKCSAERSMFLVISPIAMFVFFQFIAATQKLLGEMEEEPRHLLKIPKGDVGTSFYTQSLSTRSLAAERVARAGMIPPPELQGGTKGGPEENLPLGLMNMAMGLQEPGVHNLDPMASYGAAHESNFHQHPSGFGPPPMASFPPQDMHHNPMASMPAFAGPVPAY